MNSGLTPAWIIGLCVTAALAVIGWTVSVTQALRMRVFQTMERDQAALVASVSAALARIGVLETKYDSITAALLEIKIMLQKHLGV